jgi:serine/threonine protein kinase
MLAAGHILGEFEILESIGVGGMGVVCKERQQGLNRTLAVKVLQPSFVSDTDFLACFGTRRFWFVCRWIYNRAGRGLVFRYDDIPKINAKERTVGDGGCCLGRGVQDD